MAPNTYHPSAYQITHQGITAEDPELSAAVSKLFAALWESLVESNPDEAFYVHAGGQEIVADSLQTTGRNTQDPGAPQQRYSHMIGVSLIEGYAHFHDMMSRLDRHLRDVPQMKD